MTIGPPQATGSFNGLAANKRNLKPFSPALTLIISPSSKIATVFSSTNSLFPKYPSR
ncbi:hypothetical protein MBCUR_00100 [Methanobrevibacter curvatus]|uniref:Uncharacterized protein n=1 Tax=Methanobrevibacter curvatus TaxID=49547 RepID=A0A166ERM0_9EURY|nr:hypothetical protein MBCUR_00100 [Methanobrevibacter curvatus]